jgi:hypothetical protein
MSDERSVERQLGRPLRPSLPHGETDLDDEPLMRKARPAGRGEHWPDEAPPGQANEDFSVTEGELLETLQWYFPLFWLACLIVVSYIGIYYAVDQITEGYGKANPLPPAWF